MQYMGGKTRIAKRISEAILDNSNSRKYYLEPFVGSCSVFKEVAPHFEWSVAGDAQPDLIEMWNALVFQGWEPPENLSNTEWVDLRDSSPSALRAFAGFNCSYAGRFFEGYARDRTGKTNFAAKGRRGLLSDVERIKTANVGVFRNWTYGTWKPLPGTVIYCDPPYRGTKRYSSKRSQVPEFDHDDFWDTVRMWELHGCEVFVSEYTAPEDFQAVYEVQKIQSTKRPEQGRDTVTEKLFRWASH